MYFRAIILKTQTNQNQIKDPSEGVIFSSQVACSVTWSFTSPEMSIQVQQNVLATAQTLPFSAK